MMSKYRQTAAVLCGLAAVSLLGGQLLKNSVTWAPLTGWVAGGVFLGAALVMAAIDLAGRN